jgi:hypothetical protein
MKTFFFKYGEWGIKKSAFSTDLKNVIDLSKSAHNNVLSQKLFDHLTYSKKNSFHLIKGSMFIFYDPIRKQPLNLWKTGFCKHVLDFHLPFKILCQTSGCQNHWSRVRILRWVEIAAVSHCKF